MELDDGMNKEAWRQAWEYRGRQDRERAAKVRASELERGLLATVILDRHARDPLFAKVNADYFSSRPHTHLWRAIKAMHEREAHIERATLLDTLVEYDGLLDALGGEHELDALADGDLVLEDWREGARLFADREWSHSTAAELEEIIARLYDPLEDRRQLKDDLLKTYNTALDEGEHEESSGPKSAKEVSKEAFSLLEEWHQNESGLTGFSWGIDALDQFTQGAQPGDLVIIAARPGMGKTSFSLGTAYKAALDRKQHALFFSLEMERRQLMLRIFASHARVPFSRIRSGRLTEHQWAAIIKAAGSASESELYIDDTPRISLWELKARTRRAHARRPLDAIFVDYLQLVKYPGAPSREREVAEVSMELKSLAKELSIPVFALAQLNRGVESRANKRPGLADLRESGQIEQDADIIVFLYREDMYEDDDPGQPSSTAEAGVAEAIFAKFRNGGQGIVKMKFDGPTMSFEELENAENAMF